MCAHTNQRTHKIHSAHLFHYIIAFIRNARKFHLYALCFSYPSRSFPFHPHFSRLISHLCHTHLLIILNALKIRKSLKKLFVICSSIQYNIVYFDFFLVCKNLQNVLSVFFFFLLSNVSNHEKICSIQSKLM